MKETFWANWDLKVSDGRAVWHFTPPEGLSNADWTGEMSDAQHEFLRQMSEAFVYDKNTNPNSADRVYRTACEAKANRTAISDSPTSDILKSSIEDLRTRAGAAARAGIGYYETLQAGDGCWPGDYGGPMFLLPGLVIASYVTGSPFAAPHQALMKRYMLNHQQPDGGWGLHVEGASTMFGTVLQYAALRLLGMDADDAPMTKARKWIKEHGGATGIPSWGKFYLCLLGVYDWSGCNSLFPEMWLLPEGLPFHPSRYWCHSRMVYLPMAYCYGHRVTAAPTALTDALRTELYVCDYASIDWVKARNECTETDLYYPQTGTLRALNKILNIYEGIHLKGLRKKALDFSLEYINAEDEQTEYINIGPVNQVINSIAVWHAYGSASILFQKHRERWHDYLWLAEDGMKMQGYNGSQLWETAFAVQAITESGYHIEYPKVAAKAYDYIDRAQIRSEVRDRARFFRHIQIGGWPFSTRAHGWPISDCTAEGLKAVLALHGTSRERTIDDERLHQAVHVILSYQNKDGGWATYENTRAPAWIEALNPSEIFGGIMTDYSYTECTAACVQALIRFQQSYPGHRDGDTREAIRRGIEFILAQQRSDGSWYGSWAVCFTYGTWFGVEALSQFIAMPGAPSSLVQKAGAAVDMASIFLISKQNADGGWGESFQSCVQKSYIPSPASQVVNTSWALLSLMVAGHSDIAPIDRGIALLMDRQSPTGDWAQENISGVFNHNCMITYTAYRNVFPIWALGRYGRR